MGSTELRRRGTNPQRLTDKQQVFVMEYCVDMNGARAAGVAGYKHPTVAASKLLNKDLNPLVHAAIGKALHDKEKRAKYSADDILAYIHSAIFVNPFRYFEPGDNGGWLIDPKKFKELPDELGRLIEECELREIETEHSVIKKYWIKLVSKTAMVGLAAKHQLTEHLEITSRTQWDWDTLSAPPGGVDAVQARIEEATRLAQTEGPLVIETTAIAHEEG